jgi:competence protein ComEC
MAKKLSSDILIAPHHGSKSSSSRVFLTAVMPRYVVFSTGYLNRWQMPSDEIMGRYNSFDITAFNTVDEGMVTFKFSQTTGNANIDPSANDDNKGNIADTVIDASVEVISYRDDIRPYWFVN